MPVEYNSILLGENCEAKISWYRVYFLHKKILIKIFVSQYKENCTPESGIEGGRGSANKRMGEGVEKTKS